MKTISIILLSILLSISTFAQRKIKVTESSENIGGAKHNALVVTIYESNEKDILHEWKNLMKDYKGKISNGSELFSDNTSIPAISANTIDIYARVETSGDSYKLIIGFDLGGAYLSSKEHGSGYKEAEKIVYDFAVKISKSAVEDEKKAQEKELKSAERKQEKLVNENEKLNKNIADWQDKIKQAQKDLETNVKNQEEAKALIETNKKKVQVVTDKLNAIQ